MIAAIPYLQFCMAHNDWYEHLERYIPSDELLRVVRTAMPPDWRIERSQVWFLVRPAHPQLRQQGWKIHVSATPLNCAQILQQTAAICFEQRATFKFAVDRHMVDLMSSKGWSRPSSAKCITVYPQDDDHFYALTGALSAALQGLAGPYVLTDRRCADSQAVFYRYGGITEYTRLTVNGEHQHMLVCPDGSLEPDRRTPAWHMPSWASDPFDTPEEDDEAPALKDGRYLVEEPLGFSVTGGVYRATDTLTDRAVVIKEARPCTGVDDQGRDARDHLRKEYRLLRRLQDSGVTPQPVDLFEEWEHLFLVEELIDAQDLGIYTVTHTPFGAVDLRDSDRQRYVDQIVQIWTQLTRAVMLIHARGIVCGDLSITNILIPHGSTQVRIIDLEAAWEQGVDTPVRLMTPGFTSPSGTPGCADDVFSLGALMLASLFPLNTFLSVHPAAKATLVQRLGADLGIPAALRELILVCLSDEPGERPALEHVLAVLEHSAGATVLAAPPPAPLGRSELLELIDQATRYICASADLHRSDRLFPADPNVLLTNPLSLAYGAVGVAYAIQKVRGSLPPGFCSWILAQPASPERYPPGLYLGLAGVAWGLWELGVAAPALQIMRGVREHPLLWELPDVFYGAAGYGLACLRFYLATADRGWLEQARRVGAFLTAQRQEHQQGCCWPDQEGQIWLGYPRGASGIALFLLYLSCATGDPQTLALAEQGMAFDIAHLHETPEGYLSTPRGVLNAPDPERVITHYWLDGSAGVATSLVRFWAHTGRADYRAVFDRLAPDTIRRYTVFPGLFQGQAGLGNLQLDAYLFTGDQRYLRAAQQTAQSIALYQTPRPEGCAFPGTHLLRITTDYATGSAGIVLFLHRLAHIDQRLENFNFTLDSLLKASG